MLKIKLLLIGLISLLFLGCGGNTPNPNVETRNLEINAKFFYYETNKEKVLKNGLRFNPKELNGFSKGILAVQNIETKKKYAIKYKNNQMIANLPKGKYKISLIYLKGSIFEKKKFKLNMENGTYQPKEDPFIIDLTTDQKYEFRVNLIRNFKLDFVGVLEDIFYGADRDKVKDFLEISFTHKNGNNNYKYYFDEKQKLPLLKYSGKTLVTLNTNLELLVLLFNKEGERWDDKVDIARDYGLSQNGIRRLVDIIEEEPKKMFTLKEWNSFLK